MSIAIHPNLTIHKYHEGTGDPAYGWTAECARDLLTHFFPDTEIELLSSDTILDDDLSSVRILLAGHVSVSLLDRMPHLQWIQFPGSGADHFFKISKLWPDDFRARGVKVLNCPGISKYPVAEHAMAMILALGRGLPRAMEQQTRREWAVFAVDELRGKTLAIIGLGHIGERVAYLARAFGMWVVGTKRDPSSHEGNAHVVLPSKQNADVVGSADYILLSAPLSEATRASFDHTMFARMKPSAFFINVSRGENVVEADLIDALLSKKIAGAALDTFGPASLDDPKKLEALVADSALWSCPNVLIVPNNAAATSQYMSYFVDSVSENYRRWRASEPFGSVVA